MRAKEYSTRHLGLGNCRYLHTDSARCFGSHFRNWRRRHHGANYDRLLQARQSAGDCLQQLCHFYRVGDAILYHNQREALGKGRDMHRILARKPDATNCPYRIDYGCLVQLGHAIACDVDLPLPFTSSHVYKNWVQSIEPLPEREQRNGGKFGKGLRYRGC